MTATAQKTKRGHTFVPGQPKPSAAPRQRRKPFIASRGDTPPAVGPFGLAVQDETTGRWKRSLTPEGWAELDRWMRDVPDDRPELQRSLSGLLQHVHFGVYASARGAGMTNEDVCQLCYIACVRAMQTFDPATGHQFTTYAIHWMRNFVGRAAERLLPHLKHGKRIVSTSAPLARRDRETLGDSLGKPDTVDPDASGRAAAVREAIRKAIPDARHRRIVAARYGLDDGRDKSLDEVGRLFGITRERVRQIVGKAEKRLERWLRPVADRYMR